AAITGCAAVAITGKTGCSGGLGWALSPATSAVLVWQLPHKTHQQDGSSIQFLCLLSATFSSLVIHFAPQTSTSIRCEMSLGSGSRGQSAFGKSDRVMRAA